MIDPAPAWEMMRSAPLIAAWMPVAFCRRPNEKNKTNEETERFSDETNLSEKESRWKESLWENAELLSEEERYFETERPARCCWWWWWILTVKR